MRLNGTPVDRFALNDARHRYRIALPAAAQQAGRQPAALRVRRAPPRPPTPIRRASTGASSARPSTASSIGAASDAVARGPAGPRRAAPVRRERREGRAGADARRARRRPLRAPAAAGRGAALHARAASRRRAPRPAPASFRVLLEDEARRRARDLEPGRGRARQAASESSRSRCRGAPATSCASALAVGRGRAAALRLGPLRSTPRARHGRAASRSSPSRSRRSSTRAPIRCGAACAAVNVLFVILDAGARALVRRYGYPRETTPEIDRIAARGRRLRARLHAGGLHARRDVVGVDVAVPRPPPQRGVVLGAAAEGPPDARGAAVGAAASHTAGFVANAVAGRLFGFDRGFSEFHEVFDARSAAAPTCFRQVLPAWLRQNRDRRFFAYVHFREPHFPYDPPAAVRHALRPRRPDPQGRAPRPGLLPRREPGPAGVQRGGARAPRAALRRQPRLRRPGGRARSCAALEAEGLLGAHAS